MKLFCIRKRREFFQVETISKDVRKMILPSFMFLFNSFFLKSVVLSVKKIKI